MPPEAEGGAPASLLPAALGLTTFVSMLGAGIVAPFLPIYAQELGANGLALGMIFSAFAASRLVVTPYVGVLSDRHGRKGFLLAGLVGLALAALAFLAATTPGHLVIIRLGQGLAAAMVLPVTMAMVADLSPLGQEGRSMGLLNTAFMLGWGLGPIVGGLVYDHAGLDANFLLMAGMALATTLLVALKVRDQPRSRSRAQQQSWSQWLALMADRRMMAVVLSRAGLSAQVGCMVAFLPLLGRDLGLSAGQVGLFISVNVMVMTGLQAPMGRLADRFSRVGMVLAGQTLAGLGMAALPLAHSYAALLALAVVMGLGSGAAVPAVSALAVSEGKRLGAGMGLTMGVFNAGFSLGILVGPVAGGLLADFSNFRAPIYLGGALCVAGGVALLAMHGRRALS